MDKERSLYDNDMERMRILAEVSRVCDTCYIILGKEWGRGESMELPDLIDLARDIFSEIPEDEKLELTEHEITGVCTNAYFAFYEEMKLLMESMENQWERLQ